MMDGEANCLVTDKGIPFNQEGIHPDCPLIEIEELTEKVFHFLVREHILTPLDALTLEEYFIKYAKDGERRTDETD